MLFAKGMVMASKGFGFAIDYDKEIALDEASIADAERCLSSGWLKPEGFAYAYSLAWHLISNEAAATAFGLGLEERLALAWTHEFSEESIQLAGLPVRDPKIPSWYRVGDQIAKRVFEATSWSTDLLTEKQAKKWRAKAKADLARHKRNQAKYGRFR